MHGVQGLATANGNANNFDTTLFWNDSEAFPVIKYPISDLISVQKFQLCIFTVNIGTF